MSKRYVCEHVDDAWIDTAPIKMINTVVIAATPQQIWAAFEDAAAWPRWATVIKHVEWTSPKPFGVGTTRTVTMAGKMTGFEEFIAWEPYTKLGFRFNEASMDGISAFAERYDLVPVDGRTSVTWTMVMAPKGVSKVIVPVTRPIMQRMFGRMLRTFKTLVESEYTTAAA